MNLLHSKGLEIEPPTIHLRDMSTYQLRQPLGLGDICFLHTDIQTISKHDIYRFIITRKTYFLRK